MEEIDKKKEETPVAPQPWKYCKIIAIVALILAIALLAFVLFAPSSPKNMIGGKKGWAGKKMRGGCGCAATPM